MALIAKGLTFAIGPSALQSAFRLAARRRHSAANPARVSRRGRRNSLGSGGERHRQQGDSGAQGHRYATKTINGRPQSEELQRSLNQFMAKRGGKTIASKGKSLKRSNAALFASIERRYGVPAGPLIAIWGMETGFGSFMGNSNILSAVATLAYDCRRSEYFTGQLYGALKLVQNGTLSPGAIGAAHGEIGHTQFLPVNVIKYGVDGDGNGRVDLIRSRRTR